MWEGKREMSAIVPKSVSDKVRPPMASQVAETMVEIPALRVKTTIMVVSSQIWPTMTCIERRAFGVSSELFLGRHKMLIDDDGWCWRSSNFGVAVGFEQERENTAQKRGESW